MTEVKRYNYIFKEPFGDDSRFDWITNSLLGDIRTFLDGIEYFIINKHEKVGKRPRGGGNLSVPILINTALEFVAALYAGKTDYMHFEIDKELAKHLGDGKEVPEELKGEFTSRKFPLPEKNEIKEIATDEEWEIRDVEKNKIYYVVKKKNKLSFLFLEKADYEARNNVKLFIMQYFPEEYKYIPLLLWDGIRNGLVHTFASKPFKYNDRYIRFQFFVEDQNLPSHIEKAGNTTLIRINVFELFRIFEKAVDVYRAELENSDELKEKFVRAWSSIEEYTKILKATPGQEKEVNEIDTYLDSKASALVLKSLNDIPGIDALKIYSLNSLKVRRS